MPTILRPLAAATGARRKLDPRLFALLELTDEAFGVTRQESFTEAPAQKGLRRSGPLAFLEGPIPRKRSAASMQEGMVRRTGAEAASGFAASASTVPVFITVRDEGAFSRLGVAIRSRAGNIATAFLRTDEILRLEDEDDVLCIEWTGGARPTATGARSGPGVAARKELGLETWRQTTLDGRGGYIGVVDTGGIDIYHPDFVDDSNVSRIAWLWDQTAEGRGLGCLGLPPPEWGYGIEFDRQALYVELNPNRTQRYSAVDHRAEKRSHGTMVAGVAAGLGAEDEQARGIAPGAELIYVGTFGSGERALASMTELAEAVDYVFARAARDGKPCVVNLSLGDDLGPRDGTSAVERFFEELLRTPGRAIVIAAGNSAGRRKHLTGTLGEFETVPGGTARVRDVEDAIEFVVGRRSIPHVVIEIWFEAGRGPSLEVIPPGDHGSTGRIAPTDGARAFEIHGTHFIVSGADPYPNSENGLLRLEIFTAGELELLDGKWKLVLHAKDDTTCTWHAWIDHPHIQWEGPTHDADLATTITSPGTCCSAITVGAYESGMACAASFSGRGPGRGGVRKPDLVACGVDIVTASASTPRRYERRFSGTSAAAPQVSGAVALLFQRFGPGLRAEEIKARLLAMADRLDLEVPDAGQGFGRARVAGLAVEKDTGSASAPPATRQDSAPHEGGREKREGSESMKSRDNMGSGDGQGGPQKRYWPDNTQIVDGYYILKQNDQVVGKLLVKPGASSTESIEYWGLYPSYRWPSDRNSPESITFEYEGPHGTWDKMEDFRETLPTGTTFVTATCSQETL